MNASYFLVTVLAAAISNPLAIVLMVSMGFVHNAGRAAAVALVGTVVAVALWLALFTGGNLQYLLSWSAVLPLAAGTLIWAAVGWAIGRAVRRVRRHMAAVETLAAANVWASPATVAGASLAALSQQLAIIHRALDLGEKLSAAVSTSAGASNSTHAAIERDLVELKAGHAQLQRSRQTLSVEAAQRLDEIAAQFDAAWRFVNQRG